MTHADIARNLRRLAREPWRDFQFRDRCLQTARQITNLVGADEDTARNLRAFIRRNVELFETHRTNQ